VSTTRCSRSVWCRKRNDNPAEDDQNEAKRGHKDVRCRKDVQAEDVNWDKRDCGEVRDYEEQHDDAVGARLAFLNKSFEALSQQVWPSAHHA
jgi:hypothetical protein